MNYYVVNEYLIENLINEVNKLLDQGWELQGGISCSLSESDDYHYTEYCQALIKKA